MSPDVVTTEALKKLEHHIVSDDYEDQLDWLCSVVLDETLKEMTRYPKTKDASALLSQVRRLSAAAQRIDDRVEIEAESLDAMFSLGWSRDKVAFGLYGNDVYEETMKFFEQLKQDLALRKRSPIWISRVA